MKGPQPHTGLERLAKPCIEIRPCWNLIVLGGQQGETLRVAHPLPEGDSLRRAVRHKTFYNSDHSSAGDSAVSTYRQSFKAS